MFPIVIVLALGLAITIERYIYLQAASTRNQLAWKKIQGLLASGNMEQVSSYAESSKTAIGKILGYGINRAKVSRRRDEVETAMEEGLMEIVPKLEKRTHYLATFANVATLLGLLGTIIGLIDAFDDFFFGLCS